MSSLWSNLYSTRSSDDGGRSTAFFEADQAGADVGSILAAARSELPFMQPNKLTFDKLLGEGTTFKVNREIFSAPMLMAGEYYVAVKHMKLARRTPEERRQLTRSVMREVRVMMHPDLRNHGCIVPILAYGWLNDPKDGAIPYIVTDYTEHDTLRTYLTNFFGKVSADERRELALDVAIGLAALHKHGIVHGDVKPNNVLVYGSTGDEVGRQVVRPQTAKISDFGSVVFQDEAQTGLASYLGTPIYNSPEVHGWPNTTLAQDGPTVFDAYCKADTYSFGLLVWEVMGNGSCFLDDGMAGFISDRQGTDKLFKIYDQGPDALLQHALVYNESVPDYPSASEDIRMAIGATLKGCLRDDPRSRDNMQGVAEKLAKGTTLVRHPPSYPLPLSSPPRGFTAIQARTPKGFYTRGSNPEVAIPIPYLLKPNQPPYIKRWNETSNEWVLTEEVDPYKFARKIAPEYPKRPDEGSSQWVNQRAFNVFETTRDNSPPWDVQCAVIDSLKADALREQNLQKRANAHLQLAVCHHIGFGCSPNGQQTLDHLAKASEHDDVARSLYPHVTFALALDDRVERTQHVQRLPIGCAQSHTNHTEEIRGVLHRTLSKAKPANVSYRGRKVLQSLLASPSSALWEDLKSSEMVKIEGADGSTSILPVLNWFAGLNDPQPLHMLLDQHCSEGELEDALSQACRAGLLENALLIAKKCAGFRLFCGETWPTSLHWLIMFDTNDAVRLAGLLTTNGWPLGVETISQNVLRVPELCVELYGTPLHWAVRCRNLSLAERFLDLGADINRRWRKEIPIDNAVVDDRLSLSYSALDLAAMWHYPELIRLLLDRGAEVYGGDFFEKHHAICLIGAPVRPLARFAVHEEAAELAMKDTIAIFLHYGHRLALQNSRGETAWDIAFAHCDQDNYVLEVLQQSGAGPGRGGHTSAASIAKDAMVRRCSIARLELALSFAVDPNEWDGEGRNALHHASAYSSVMMVERLLREPRIRVDAPTRDGQTALTLAAKTGADGIVLSLISAGVDVDACDADGRFPLEYALESRQTAMAAMLSVNGATVIFDSPRGTIACQTRDSVACNRPTTALILATSNKLQGTSILREILSACEQLQQSSVLNYRDANDWTAMHHTVWFGDHEGMCALLAAGADKSAVSRNGLPVKRRTGTPVQLAHRRLESMEALGPKGWESNSCQWILKGGPAVWNAYLDNLRRIIADLNV